ncbi:MAG TPA: hypothetical protein VEJ88_01500 [Dissulfurispiraceae bacterium]|nr:hypothetical protein [Dissulfurispiraceae bacterium]
MEARIVIIIVSLFREIIDGLNKLVNFAAAPMPKVYQDATGLVGGVRDNVLQQALPIFSKVVQDQDDLIKYKHTKYFF